MGWDLRPRGERLTGQSGLAAESPDLVPTQNGHLLAHSVNNRHNSNVVMSPPGSTKEISIPEGWDGLGAGREVQDQEDVGIPTGNSCRCMVETNRIL